MAAEGRSKAEDEAAARRRAVMLLGLACTGLLVVAIVRWQRPMTVDALPPRETGYRIDINHADTEELCLLPGIGPRIAQRIVIHRRRAGPFARVEQLRQVKGIGEKTVAKVRPYVVCGPARPER
jgi:competence ComEA-like helix-hairpin-helix protein